MTLTADALASRHRYLARARPDWTGSMATIRAQGGPWPCSSCGNASVLVYRCSACGRDLADEGTTHGGQA